VAVLQRWGPLGSRGLGPWPPLGERDPWRPWDSRVWHPRLLRLVRLITDAQHCAEHQPTNSIASASAQERRPLHAGHELSFFQMT
jgi:hypothetical protein